MNLLTTSRFALLVDSAFDDSESPQAAMNIAANMIPKSSMGVFSLYIIQPILALAGPKLD